MMNYRQTSDYANAASARAIIIVPSANSIIRIIAISG